MSAPRVSVVIPSWNGAGLLPMALASLRGQRERDFETVVVDNGSADATVELLRRDFPEVRVLELEENRGFSAAVNAGIRSSSGEYVAVLNNDVEVDPGWLEALVEALERHPEAGSAASRVRQHRRRDLIDSAGDMISVNPFPRGHDEPDGPRFDQAAEVTTAAGSAALYRRAMLERVGLFNEDFFAYFEDVELGMRARVAGYSCIYVPDAVAYHMGSTTARRIPRRVLRYRLRNSVHVYLTTLPAAYLRRHLPRLLASKVAEVAEARAPLVGIRVLAALIGDVPRILRRRREVYALRAVSDAEIERALLEPGPVRSPLGVRLAGAPAEAPVARPGAGGGGS